MIDVDPRIEAVETALKRYTSPGHTNGWGAVQGFGMSVAEILAAADAVDPLHASSGVLPAPTDDLLAKLRELHQPEKRWQASPDEAWSWDTPEEARDEIDGDGEPTFFEICAHCGDLEGRHPEHDFMDSLWPCATAKLVAAAVGGDLVQLDANRRVPDSSRAAGTSIGADLPKPDEGMCPNCPNDLMEGHCIECGWPDHQSPEEERQCSKLAGHDGEHWSWVPDTGQVARCPEPTTNVHASSGVLPAPTETATKQARIARALTWLVNLHDEPQSERQTFLAWEHAHEVLAVGGDQPDADEAAKKLDAIRLLAEAAQVSLPNNGYTGVSWRGVLEILDGGDLPKSDPQKLDPERMARMRTVGVREQIDCCSEAVHEPHNWRSDVLGSFAHCSGRPSGVLPEQPQPVSASKIEKRQQ